jgi:hypothetical protein
MVKIEVVWLRAVGTEGVAGDRKWAANSEHGRHGPPQRKTATSWRTLALSAVTSWTARSMSSGTHLASGGSLRYLLTRRPSSSRTRAHEDEASVCAQCRASCRPDFRTRHALTRGS